MLTLEWVQQFVIIFIMIKKTSFPMRSICLNSFHLVNCVCEKTFSKLLIIFHTYNIMYCKTVIIMHQTSTTPTNVMCVPFSICCWNIVGDKILFACLLIIDAFSRYSACFTLRSSLSLFHGKKRRWQWADNQRKVWGREGMEVIITITLFTLTRLSNYRLICR